jgi:hypothetical protein
MENKKLTAVEWLVNQLNEKIDFIPLDKWDMIRDIVQQAKVIEKLQIIDAVYHNCSSMTHYDLPCGEQYYNEQFGISD